MKKMSKFRKGLLAIIGGLTVAGAGIGVTLPLVTSNNNHENSLNNSSSNNGSNLKVNGSVISTDNLNIVATGLSSNVSSQVSRQSLSSSSSSESTVDSKYTAKKKLTTVSGQEKEYLVSTVYENNRKFMPILAYDEDISYNNYQQSREYKDVVYGNFPGWDKKVAVVHQIDNVDLSKAYASVAEFTPTEILKNPSAPESVKQLYVALDSKTMTADVITKLVDRYQPDYLRIESVDDTSIKQLPDMKYFSTVKKVDLGGAFTTIKGVSFPTTTQELKISSDNIKSIDPLQIPESAAIITETVHDARFTEIDLSSHTDLTTDQLQKAVNIVYKDRIKERAFQGNFAGGYIYSWNLQNTGITSFNDVSIPKLNDGTDRFYIAYVAVSSGNSNGTANETITGGKEPSNDSQIGEWWDSSSDGWSKVSKVTVTAKNGASLDYNKTLTEIMGFLAKYPNVKTIDISLLKFEDASKTLDGLKTELTNQIKSKYGEDSSYAKIDFIITSQSN
ncbi:conserved hypothetical protein [Malacoplasma penetrans HF-2]|uniref:MG281-like antibody-binding region domain-containing protein n=1 Tax=Malacoplasma penetrans (strain HF-2) TaxID=272633 RepID=Q8EWR5_MALP2|nr:IgG-blocking protein M [Malacoplasma penetrans]BAC43929.1 conserved hypothetical protein [Malacoplasma penetrans HF-2]